MSNILSKFQNKMEKFKDSKIEEKQLYLVILNNEVKVHLAECVNERLLLVEENYNDPKAEDITDQVLFIAVVD